MKIRNTRDVALLVPSLHAHAEPGQTIRVPNGAPIPDGFELVEQPARRPRAPKPESTAPQAAADDQPTQKETNQ